MLLKEIIKQAFNNLRVNKLRSILTLFGISWGIIAIMILLGWGFGVKDFVSVGMSRIGENLIVVLPGHTSKGLGGYKAGRPITPEIKDIEAIKIQCSTVKYVAPVFNRRYDVKVGNTTRSQRIRGIAPETKTVNNWEVAEGRFINKSDMKERRRFVFLGAEIKKTLFGKENSVVGKELKINGIRFKVVGVAKSKKPQMSQINGPDDEQILIPFTTAQSLWGDNKKVDFLFIVPEDPGKSSECVKEIRTILAKRHNFMPDDEEALWISDLTYYKNLMNIMLLGMNILLGVVGITTLFIGGIGVMNIMLVSVQERTREIGIRKAVGAKKRDIKFQFLAETLVITILGGIIGLFIGTALLWFVSILPLPEYIPLPQNSFLLTSIVIFVMILTGVISGYIPAKKAANLLPIQALQYERGEITNGKKIPKPLWVSKTLTGEMIGHAIMELRISKGRSLLTMFGILWGIAAVIILVGFGAGFNYYYSKEMAKIGEKLIRVYPGKAKKKIGGFREGKRIYFTDKDVRALNYSPYEISRAAPEINCGFPVVKYRNENRAVHTLGVVNETLEMRGFKIKKGRFINYRDVKDKAKVCFIGAGVKERLFGKENNKVVGEYLRVNGIRFRVIGLAEKKGMQMSINNSLDDDKLLIPYTTARKIFRKDKFLTNLLVEPKKKDRYKQAKKEINQVLGRIHNFKPDDEEAISEWSELDGYEIFNYITLGLQVFLGGIGFITLLIGGVGVMNVMLFTVTQRTREIGIRRAVGARQKHIFIQFLIEALLITFIGGIIGSGIGSGVNFILNKLPLPEYFPPPHTSAAVMIITAFFIISVGIFSGILPATRAMKLNVVESLRYE